MSEASTFPEGRSAPPLGSASRIIFPFLEHSGIADEDARGRLFVSIIAFAGIPALLYFGALNLRNGHLVLGGLEFVCAALCAVMYVVARKHSVRFMPRVVLLFSILIVAYAHASPSVGITLLWPVIFPVLVTFVFGGREGLLWSVGLFAFWWVLFSQPAWLGLTPDSLYWPDQGQLADFFFCYVLVVLLTLGYESLRTSAMRLADDRQRELGAALGRLRESEHRLRDFADTASDWLFELDAQLRTTWISSRWKGLTGLQPEDVLGRSILDFVQAPAFDEAEAVRARLGRREPLRNVRQRVERPDGTVLHVSVRADPMFDESGGFLGYRGAAQDVTERERAAEEMREKDRALVQSSKMEAVGQLTSGVAHDFNNLLTVIVGNLELLAMRLDDPDSEGEELDQAMAASRRAADLTSKLLSFSRRQTLKPEVVEPGPMLDDMHDLLRRALGEAVTVAVEVLPGTWHCEVDRSQLENALLNLAINGRDAMESGGRLSIVASARQVDADEAERLELAAGDYVSFSVVDTGCGMPPELLDHVFEPFFSTKPQGQGTGLGLSMVYGFARQSGGGVAIDSAPGAGTTVELLLPRATGVTTEAPVPARKPRASGGGRRVLVVEDEDGVRDLVRAMLDQLGYVSDVAATVEEAIALHDASTYDLVLTDVVLAGGDNGLDLVRTLRERTPGVRALFMSGYSEEAFRSRGSGDEPLELLLKPFGLVALGDRIEQMLQD
ncbi:MAG: ATP-binding protein [Pseudomonadales bacterium]|jgi:PAS domain S-box-containing protein|nr:ATP-binding protein [Pseudomonadales bacterium]